MSVGFIILRHVNSEKTNNYWKLSHKSIRNFFPDNHIIIIDDNSNYDYIDIKYEEELPNITIIRSKFQKRGEILPYYYYLKNHFFDTAVIIHDSVFINSKIDTFVEEYKFLWDFKHHSDQPEDEIKIISSLKNNGELLTFHNNKSLWDGCFGGMCIIKYDFLKKIDILYNLENMLPYITSRYNRMSFERVIACLLVKNGSNNVSSLFGNIINYCPWGISYEQYLNYNHLPAIKIWSSR